MIKEIVLRSSVLKIGSLFLLFALAIVGCQSETLLDVEAVPTATREEVVLETAVSPTPTSTIEPTQSTPTTSDVPLGTTHVRTADGMVQLYVPAGSFMMGSAEASETAVSNEIPQHEVSLSAYWIDQTEVTVSQFRTFVDATGHETTAEAKGSGFIFDGTWHLETGAMWEHPLGPDSVAEPKHPATQLSWSDAVAYCEWAGGSLPTEAQWEYAARGSEGNIYPWGNSFDSSKLNYCDDNCEQEWKDDTFDDGFALTAPVGSFPEGQSWVGAFDMAGNVWEWVNDWQGDYAADVQENPTGPDSGSVKVLRGGGWVGDQNSARSARRGGNSPDTRGIPDGFRCVAPVID